MRLLLDENFPRLTVQALQKSGHDLVWILLDKPGLSDKAILDWAAEDHRLVLTLDKDFRQLSIHRKAIGNCGVLLFRVHPALPSKLTPIVLSTLAMPLDWYGHLSVIFENEIQMIRLRTD